MVLEYVPAKALAGMSTTRLSVNLYEPMPLVAVAAARVWAVPSRGTALAVTPLVKQVEPLTAQAKAEVPVPDVASDVARVCPPLALVRAVADVDNVHPAPAPLSSAAVTASVPITEPK